MNEKKRKEFLDKLNKSTKYTITIECPICGESKKLSTERRLDGYTTCLYCGHKDRTKEFSSVEEAK